MAEPPRYKHYNRPKGLKLSVKGAYYFSKVYLPLRPLLFYFIMIVQGICASRAYLIFYSTICPSPYYVLVNAANFILRHDSSQIGLNKESLPISDRFILCAGTSLSTTGLESTNRPLPIFHASIGDSRGDA